MENAPTAEEALEVATRAQRVAVDRSRAPWWYYPASGALLGLVFVVFLLAPGVLSSVALIVSVIGNRILDARRLRLTGTRVSEFRGDAAIVSLLVVAALLAALGLGMYLVFEQHLTWVAWAVGVAIVLIRMANGWLLEHVPRTSVEG